MPQGAESGRAAGVGTEPDAHSTDLIIQGSRGEGFVGLGVRVQGFRVQGFRDLGRC